MASTGRFGNLRFHITAQDCIHSGKVASAVTLEKIEDIFVDAQMDRLLANRQDNFGVGPEIRAEIGADRRIRVMVKFIPVLHPFQLTQGCGFYILFRHCFRPSKP